MNFSDFITDHGKRINKDHYSHLIQVSRIDGKISPDELEMLHKEGRKFGLTDPEIDELILSEHKHHYEPPYSLHEKFEHLYNIAEMILADDVVTDSEKKIIRKFAIEVGFSDKAIDKLLEILFEGIRKNEDEELLLDKFKKHLF
jgi:uncharacterized tellurite resistance protein B-like protein